MLRFVAEVGEHVAASPGIVHQVADNGRREGDLQQHDEQFFQVMSHRLSVLRYTRLAYHNPSPHITVAIQPTAAKLQGKGMVDDIDGRAAHAFYVGQPQIFEYTVNHERHRGHLAARQQKLGLDAVKGVGERGETRGDSNGLVKESQAVASQTWSVLVVQTLL